MEPKSKQLTAQLIKLRNAIKRKYKTFKEGTEETNMLLEKQYKPIIKELRKKSKTESVEVKEEPKEEQPSMDYELTDEEEEEEGEEFEPVTVSTPKQPELRALVDTPSKLTSTTQFIEEFFKNPTTREYMTSFIKDTSLKKHIDYIYGPRYTDGNTLMVGEKTLDFDENGNIIIGGTNYGASEGLYELIFKKVPDSAVYTKEDLKTYKSILNDTSAHKEGYKFTGRIKRNSGTKYTRIIKSLFPVAAPTRGKGMLWKNTKSRDIIHWDDANELVDRLRIIAMSTETGNQVHSNEILNIVEELREAGFIKGAGNSRYKALLK